MSKQTHTQFGAHYDESGNIVLTLNVPDSVRIEEELEEVAVTWSTSEATALASASGEADTKAAEEELAAHLQDLPEFPPNNRYARNRPQKKERLPQFPIIAGAFRFTGTFTAVFLFLFVSMNYQSFYQVFRAQVLPQNNEALRTGLEAVSNSFLAQKLPSVPALPAAGDDTNIAHQVLAIAPPDDRIIIPGIGKNIPVIKLSGAAMAREDWKMFEKDVQDALRFGVVHYPGTARPGEVGNVFITGHSSYYPWDGGRYKDVFALLPSMKIGDEYSIYYRGDLHRYRITDKYEVSPRDVTVLDQPTDRYMSTLMTCTPLGTTLRRLILEADEIDPLTGEMIAVEGAIPVANPGVWSEELPV